MPFTLSVGRLFAGLKMKTNLGDIGNKAKRTELYRKQKGDKKAEQKDRRRRREREAQELGEASLRRCIAVHQFDVNLVVMIVDVDGCVVYLLLKSRRLTCLS